MILAYCTECWAKKIWRTAENTGVFKLGDTERCEPRKRKIGVEHMSLRLG